MAGAIYARVLYYVPDTGTPIRIQGAIHADKTSQNSFAMRVVAAHAHAGCLQRQHVHVFTTGNTDTHIYAITHV